MFQCESTGSAKAQRPNAHLAHWGNSKGPDLEQRAQWGDKVREVNREPDHAGPHGPP